MAYVTTTDLEIAAGGAERLRQLADWDGIGVPSAPAVAAAIAEAEARVDAAVQLRYGVPLPAPIPPRIVALVAREVIYLLKLSRDMVTEADQLAHEERTRTLAEIGAGRQTLGVTPAPAKSAYVVDRVTPLDDRAPVSRDALKGFS